MKYFEEINKVLASKSLPPLTREEEGLLMNRCTQIAMHFSMEPKATNSEYALNKQLTVALSNAIYDVLVETRGYK